VLTCTVYHAIIFVNKTDSSVLVTIVVLSEPITDTYEQIGEQREEETIG